MTKTFYLQQIVPEARNKDQRLQLWRGFAGLSPQAEAGGSLKRST